MDEAARAGCAGPTREVVLATWAPVFDSTEAELDETVAALGLPRSPCPTSPSTASTPAPTTPHGCRGWCRPQVEVWPDLGHYPHLVEPQRFLARVAEFEATLS